MKLENLTDKEYRQIPAESYSSLKYMLESPDKFIYYKDKPFKGNTSTDLGTAVHHYIQGNKHLVHFKVKYIKADKDKEDFLDANEAFINTYPDGISLSETAQEKINEIYQNYKKNPRAVKLMEKCDFEVGFKNTIFTTSNHHVVLKGKVDGYCRDYIVDIKTTGMGTELKDFKKTVDERAYDLQAALYLALSEAKHTNYYFIVCGTQAPYPVKVYKMSDESIVRGQKKLQLAVDNYKKYIINKEPYEEPDEEV